MKPAAPHRRQNALTGDWILVSPQRTSRPWRGRVERPAPERWPGHEPGCYLCPGNRRANGEVNPAYAGTYVFPNDFPALLPGEAGQPEPGHPLLAARAVRGECRVICFSPRHDLTLPQMMDLCVPFMVEKGMDATSARKILEDCLPKLKRWR